MFSLQTQVFTGQGSTRDAVKLLSQHGWRDVAVLVDEAVVSASNAWATTLGQLQEVASLNIIPLRSGAEPTYSYLDEVAEKVRSLPALDLIIGIGGGSALDTAKAVAILRTNPGPGIDYRGFDLVKNPGVPTVCIPTTAGTGSEVTINAVFTDEVEGKKLGINGAHMAATYAVLDADWTESCPRSVALSSGLDAMVHTLESFMTHKSTSITRTLSSNAFKLIYTNLPLALAQPSEPQTRQGVLLGAYFAAAALFNSGSGIAGGMSYPIGVHHHVPHGIAGGIVLPSVVRFNIDAGWYGFAELHDLISPNWSLTACEKADAFGQLLDQWYREMQVPTDYGQWGLTSHDLSRLSEYMLPLQAAFDQNPVAFSAKSDAPALLAKHLS